MLPSACQTLRDHASSELRVALAASEDLDHLATCTACQRWLDELRALVAQLAATPPPALPTGFEAALLQRLEAAPAPTHLGPRRSWAPSRPALGLAMAAAALIALVLAGEHATRTLQALERSPTFTLSVAVTSPKGGPPLAVQVQLPDGVEPADGGPMAATSWTIEPGSATPPVEIHLVAPDGVRGAITVTACSTGDCWLRRGELRIPPRPGFFEAFSRAGQRGQTHHLTFQAEPLEAVIPATPQERDPMTRTTTLAAAALLAMSSQAVHAEPSIELDVKPVSEEPATGADDAQPMDEGHMDDGHMDDGHMMDHDVPSHGDGHMDDGHMDDDHMDDDHMDDDHMDDGHGMMDEAHGMQPVDLHPCLGEHDERMHASGTMEGMHDGGEMSGMNTETSSEAMDHDCEMMDMGAEGSMMHGDGHMDDGHMDDGHMDDGHMDDGHMSGGDDGHDGGGMH